MCFPDDNRYSAPQPTPTSETTKMSLPVSPIIGTSATPTKEAPTGYEDISKHATVTPDVPICFPYIREVKQETFPNHPGLRAKATFSQEIQTPAEETLIRSLHPSLKDCKKVSVIENGTIKSPIWLVEAKYAKGIVHTHAADREIHVLPEFVLPPLGARMAPARYAPIRIINPRCFLSTKDVEAIRDAFPGSVAAQILISGWLIVLYPSKKSMDANWRKGVPDEVGGLRVAFNISKFKTTASVVESSRAVATEPSKFDQHAAIGLRLRLPGGLDCITSVTHAFVRMADPKMSNRRKKLLEHVLTAKSYLKRMRPQPSQATEAGIVHTKWLVNSPLGKTVWLGGTNQSIGKITVTYDPCNRHMLIPYPHGFEYDLSLITSPNLPQLINPPNTPRVIEWGSYEEALQGFPVFLNRYNISTASFFSYQGRGMTRAAQESIVHGTQYSWEIGTRTPTAALLWRTLRDTDDVQRASGSILCLGRPTDETARALVFQNFEGPLIETNHVQIGEYEDSPSFKGGFLLPEEIRNAEILTSDSAQPQEFRTPKKKGDSSMPDRLDYTI